MLLKTSVTLRNIFCFALFLQGCVAPTLPEGDIGKGPLSDPPRPLSPADAQGSELFAVLIVESIPANADIYIDDNLRGVTPMQIDGIVQGSYTLRLTVRGYRDWVRTLFLRKGEVRPVQARLTPLDGKLTSN
jgi:hypothetical protein